jgi:quercetin 2,3-dioxygenase
MLTIRPAQERGIANFGWLDSRHTFSFGEYQDPSHMGFAELRVINEDKVAPGKGFGTHGHRDMEIISYVLEGALEHKDSIGTGSVIRPGDVQRMSAGTGIAHSEFNASKTDPVHFLQIWILPERKGIEPGYEQKTFATSEKQDKLRLLGSRDGRDGSITIHQDVDLYATVLSAGESVSYEFASDRLGWAQVARGTVQLNGQLLNAGDGVAIVQESLIALQGKAQDTEVLLFDMATRTSTEQRT